MARPDPVTRAAREQRKRHWQGVRDEAKAAQERVQIEVAGVVNGAVAKSQAAAGLMPDLPDLIAKLEEARLLAMSCTKPDAAVSATMATPKLLGFVIDKMQAAVVQGTPEQFRGSDEQKRQQILDRVRSKYGETGVEKFRRMIEEIRRGVDGNLIEHEAGDGE